MIGRPLKTMIAIAVLVGTALIGLTMWAVTAERMADFGVLRALGVRPIQLSRIVIAQAAIVAALGFVFGERSRSPPSSDRRPDGRRRGRDHPDDARRDGSRHRGDGRSRRPASIAPRLPHRPVAAFRR